MQIMLQETPAIRLHPDDNIAIALVPLSAGRQLTIAGYTIQLANTISAGHKIALTTIELAAPIRRYGQIIGFATQPIQPGQHSTPTI